MVTLAYEGVGKVYPDGTRAVTDLNLSIGDGEFMVLVGPSGCGKSTSLRMAAGLEEVSEGAIHIGPDRVNDWPPRRRDVAMVFQSHALYPHMSVRENMGFSLVLRSTPDGEIRRRVGRAAEMLGISGLLERRPGSLSTGERQRTAMGRAIVRQPQVFLMDEPLSNLDAKLRVQTRAEILGLQRHLGTTTLYVTHDQVEAMTMGDRVAVMKDGLMMQCAPPQELYDLPANVFVAGFIGSPRMNIFRTTLHRDVAGNVGIRFGNGYLVLDAQYVRARSLHAVPTGPVIIGARPEAFSAVPHADDTDSIDVVVSAVEMLGSETLAYFRAPVEVVTDVGTDTLAAATRRNPGLPGVPDVMCARLTPPVRMQAGTGLRLSVDTRKFYFFDARGHLIS